MRTRKIAFGTSLGLFVFSLLLPAVDLNPWHDGWQVFCLSFFGLVMSLKLDSANHVVASLLGASANALMLFTWFRIWKGRYRGARLVATTALVFTLLVLVPLASIAGVSATRVVSFGYYLWVAAAFALTISAWLEAGKPAGLARPPTKSLGRTWVIIPCLLGLVIVPILIKRWWKTREEARCATEGQAAVEAFMRDDAESVFTNDYGSFLSLEGSGYFQPVWNIQGYHYLTLERTGHFSRRSLPIRIYVTEGRVTAPGLKTVGKPRIEGLISPLQGARIFVSHPDVKP
jgi:hypothetical protein